MLFRSTEKQLVNTGYRKADNECQQEKQFCLIVALHIHLFKIHHKDISLNNMYIEIEGE